MATGEWDASAGVRPDATAASCPEPHCPVLAAGKSVAPALDAPEPDGLELPPEPPAQLAWVALCKPDAVRSVEQSCAARELEDVVAQLAPLISLLARAAVQQRRTAASLMLQALLVTRESSPRAVGSDASEPESLPAAQRT